MAKLRENAWQIVVLVLGTLMVAGIAAMANLFPRVSVVETQMTDVKDDVKDIKQTVHDIAERLK